MKHKTMANLLRGVIIVLVLCGIFMHVWWIPFGTGIFFIASKAWLILLNIALLPCYAVTVIAWRIADTIGKEQEFCHRNAKYFRWIFVLALGDSVLFVLASAVLLILKLCPVWGVLFSLPLGALGICVAVCAAVMSHLIHKAADMQEDSDLTI